MNESMTITQAAKVLLKYPNQTRERLGTQYGGYGNLIECSCCGYEGRQRHAEDCELAQALRVIKEAP